MAQTFAYIGEPSEAVSIARTLHGDDRLVAFAAIIDAEARSRRTAQAAALMPELISAARRTKGDWQLRYYLGDVNPTLAQTGLHRELQTETDAILAVTKTALDRDALRRDVAQDLARAGRVAEALLMARAVEDPVQRVEAFAEMGQGLSRAGRREDALHVIDEALAAARALPDAYSRARSMSGVAEALADVGRSVDAVSVAREARETARRAKYDVDVIVVHVAPALAHAGKVPEAVKALYEVRDRADWSFDHQVDNLVGVLIYSGRLAEALAVAETAPNANRRIVRLNTVARALVKDGQKAAAIRAAREALDLTSRLHKPELVDVANAAVTLARAGAKTEALRVVRQAVASLGQGRGDDGSQYDRRKGLVTLAQALALAGDRREALRVVRRAQDQSWPAGLEDGPEQEVAVIVDTAEAGAVAAAVDLARAIPFPAERAQALTAVASVVLHDQPFPLCCKWLP